MAEEQVELDWSQPLFHPGTWADRWPDKAAVIMGDSGESISYGEMEAFANRLSQALRAAGLQRGDHVAFSLENRIEFLPILWGLHYAGLYYTAISSRLTADETAYIVRDCGARAFLTSPALGAKAADVPGLASDVGLWLTVGGPVEGYRELDAFVADSPAEPLADRREAADMLYSSGTTGRPKGVKIAAPDEPLGHRRQPVAVRGCAVQAGAQRRLPVPGAAISRSTASLHPSHPSGRRHGRGHGTFRPPPPPSS